MKFLIAEDNVPKKKIHWPMKVSIDVSERQSVLAKLIQLTN